MATAQIILKTLSVEYSGNIIKSLYDPYHYLLLVPLSYLHKKGLI